MYDVRRMKRGELEETLELIRSVFMQFEAPEYSDEGTNTFLEFIDHSNIRQGMDDGDLKFWVCTAGGGIAGTIAMKNETHVCMLFVDKNFHRRGIARKLLCSALSEVDGEEQITVNSSPYGAGFYRAVGFTDEGCLKTTNGIKYVPMKARCDKLMITIEKSLKHM